VQRFEPHWVSEHLAWSSHGGQWLNDLLPLPYEATTLHRICDHIDQVQLWLKRRLLLENPSIYVEFIASTVGLLFTTLVGRLRRSAGLRRILQHRRCACR
jgi:uncharacterized protein (UPF0276 family)